MCIFGEVISRMHNGKLLFYFNLMSHSISLSLFLPTPIIELLVDGLIEN